MRGVRAYACMADWLTHQSENPDSRQNLRFAYGFLLARSTFDLKHRQTHILDLKCVVDFDSAIYFVIGITLATLHAQI